jgi:hypothetical protein
MAKVATKASVTCRSVAGLLKMTSRMTGPPASSNVTTSDPVSFSQQHGVSDNASWSSIAAAAESSTRQQISTGSPQDLHRISTGCSKCSVLVEKVQDANIGMNSISKCGSQMTTLHKLQQCEIKKPQVT